MKKRGLDVAEYDGIYQISNVGNARSLYRS